MRDFIAWSRETGEPFTATDVIHHFGLDAGTYKYETREMDVAAQLVRNELAKMHRDGGISSLLTRRGRELEYVPCVK